MNMFVYALPLAACRPLRVMAQGDAKRPAENAMGVVTAIAPVAMAGAVAFAGFAIGDGVGKVGAGIRQAGSAVGAGLENIGAGVSDVGIGIEKLGSDVGICVLTGAVIRAYPQYTFQALGGAVFLKLGKEASRALVRQRI